MWAGECAREMREVTRNQPCFPDALALLFFRGEMNSKSWHGKCFSLLVILNPASFVQNLLKNQNFERG